METVVKRKGRGRKKIEIKKIEKRSSLYVTFSKRRAGLFKKAAKLSCLCGVDVAVIVQSPARKIFASGGQSSVNSIIDRYLAATSSTSNNVNQFQQVVRGVQDYQDDDYVEIVEKIDHEKVEEKALLEIQASGEFWWQRPFDDLDLNELEEYFDAMEVLRKNVLVKADELARINAAASRSSS